MENKIKTVIALMCILTMLIPASAFGASSNNVSEGGTDDAMTTTANTEATFEYVEFGSYPQREIVSQASDSGVYGKAWATEDDYIIDEELYSILQNLSEENWSANGDATVGENKYRRIKASDATAYITTETLYAAAPDSGPSSENETTIDPANYYGWSSEDTYHYFKYEPIKWRVLEKNDNEYFLMSEIVLDDQKYNVEIPGSIPWQYCTLRSWLNGYDSSANKYGNKNINGTDYSSDNFIDTAFTSEEQQRIDNTTVVNEDSIFDDETIEGGDDTIDKIFLLSSSEVYGDSVEVYGFANSYNKEDTARQAKSSTYAKAMGTYADCNSDCIGNAYWWLRSPGSHNGLAAIIRSSGSVDRGGMHVTSKQYRGVRPAMYVDLSETIGNKISGTVTGCPSDDVTVTLKDSDGNQTVVESNEFSFDNLKDDTYTLIASAGDSYVDREYTIVPNGKVTQNIVLYQRGDANGDGELTAADVTRIARHIARISVEEDKYMLEVFNTYKQDGVLSAADITHLAKYLAKVINTLDDETIGTTGIEIKDADGNNTTLSSKSVTVTIGDKSVDLSGAYVVDGIDATITGGTYESTESDENVFLVINGGSLTLNNAEIKKSGDASSHDSTRTSDVSDDYNFYGVNSVVLVVGGGSSATLKDCKITSNASGANAVFSTADATVQVNNVSITTTGNSSRGVYATYGGNVTAEHMEITTESAHCAPIATDRGGGTVNVSYSKVSSSGDGSPSIYSTGNISVNHIIGTSTDAQAAVVEGKNSITMNNSEFTVSGGGDNGIMLYQSMSGDASDKDATSSCSTLTMNNVKITVSNGGPLIYVTNTTTEVNIKGDNTFNIDSGIFLKAATGRWGNSGSNGGIATLNIYGSTINSSIIADSISSVNVNPEDGANFSGTTSGSVSIRE